MRKFSMFKWRNMCESCQWLSLYLSTRLQLHSLSKWYLIEESNSAPLSNIMCSFKKLMNVKVPLVQMELPAWMRSMSTTAYVHQASIIHIVKMVLNVSMKNSKKNYYNAISEIDECESNPCSNEGTCMNDINGYHCICAFGYNYTHCQNGNDEFSAKHASYIKVSIFKK